jgi:two-component system, LytTR family, sensor kinase
LKQHSRQRPETILMHPAVFIGAWVALGTVFAAQDWLNLKRWGYHIPASILFTSWGVEYLIWGVLCWIIWRILWPFILKANWFCILTRVIPLSIGVTILKELIWVPLFPTLPLNRPLMPFWQRFSFHLSAEFVDDLVVFWCAFLLFRGIGYYQKSRESAQIASQLEVQLANAKLSALRMQLNPHFLFNAMNSISSLMRSDVNAADEMLEQLSSLLRMSLERGTTQLIPLRQEFEFLEIYLLLQDRRFAGRVQRRMSIDPELHDALVPAMILQPVVENAFVHGLSRIEKNGELSIEAVRRGNELILSVINNGVGLGAVSARNNDHGIGIANVRDRLRLHYANDASLEIRELESRRVSVAMVLPLRWSDFPATQLARQAAL